MLPAGSQSWSVQLVAGADLDAADPRRVLTGPAAGKLTLADTHYNASLVQGGGWVWGPDAEQSGFEPGTPVPDDMAWLCDVIEGFCERGDANGVSVTPHTQNFSVLRTGTGDLDLNAGGDISLMSAYGVYTAGTQSANIASAYQLPRGRFGATVLGDDHAATYEPFAAHCAATRGA
ncbi:hypothetical protein G6F35_016204 [Rhizopus arrhizus]|nr:hypothetical protein G6F23_013941 [Rhizopus arrhizus]KAG1179811.1 hypothetical protein G6F35_016204 [Rhizopus arrhizus]